MNIKPIKGFEDYKITTNGDIYNKHGRKLKPKKNRGGYLCLTLCKNKKRRFVFIHTIVLENFVGERPKDYECNHKNGIKTDNRLFNLEWVTKSENNKHAYLNGLKTVPMLRGEEHPKSKLRDGEVWLIKKLLSSKMLSGVFISKLFKINKEAIYKINKGITWNHIKYP